MLTTSRIPPERFGSRPLVRTLEAAPAPGAVPPSTPTASPSSGRLGCPRCGAQTSMAAAERRRAQSSVWLLVPALDPVDSRDLAIACSPTCAAGSHAPDADRSRRGNPRRRSRGRGATRCARAPRAGWRSGSSGIPTGRTSASIELAELDERWAAIVFWHSLEHLRDAGSAVEHAARRSGDGGVIVIASPTSTAFRHVFGIVAGARSTRDTWSRPRPRARRSLDLSTPRREVSYLREARSCSVHIVPQPGRLDLYDASAVPPPAGAHPAGRRVAAIAGRDHGAPPAPRPRSSR